MRKMKDSGIEWIGKIPEDWNIVRIKFTLEGHYAGEWGSNKEDNEADCICVRVADFDYPRLEVKFHDDMTIRSYTQKTIDKSSLKRGDILLEKSGGGEVTPVGRSVIFDSDNTMMFANFIECLRPLETYDSHFLNYWLSSSYVNGFSKRNIKQTTGIQNLDITAFLSEKIALPNKEKQSLIANYLDKKCAEIDALIEAKEKANALLKEQRQSIIYEAVTKGLNPNVPMKDSGIEWIGKIPKNWDLKKIKYCFTLIAGATPKSSDSEYWDGNVVWITPADYKTEDVFVSRGHKNITEAGVASCSTTIVPENSIIFSKRAPVGLVALNAVPLCTNQGCISCVPQNGIDSKFYYYAMSAFAEQFELFASGTTFKEISADDFANFKLPYTSYDEQKTISDHLDKECENINNLMEANKITIEKLREYRKSIIFEAVTGKVEI